MKQNEELEQPHDFNPASTDVYVDWKEEFIRNTIPQKLKAAFFEGEYVVNTIQHHAAAAKEKFPIQDSGYYYRSEWEDACHDCLESFSGLKFQSEEDDKYIIDLLIIYYRSQFFDSLYDWNDWVWAAFEYWCYNDYTYYNEDDSPPHDMDSKDDIEFEIEFPR